MALQAEVSALRRMLGAQAPVQMVDAGGRTLALSRKGHGRAIVCLHAIAHGARDFEMLATRMGDEVEIIALDWPGHGCSSDDGVAPDAAHYARVLSDVLDVLKLDRPILLGCSIGGAAALRVAATRSDIGGLVLCNAGGLQAITPSARRAIGVMAKFFGAGARGAWWFGPLYRAYYRFAVLPLAPPEHRARIVAAGYEHAAPLRKGWESFARGDADTRALVGRVNVPVLFAWAKGDRILPWAKAKEAAGHAAESEVVLLKGGHAVFLEDVERFAAVLRGFLQKVKGR